MDDVLGRFFARLQQDLSAAARRATAAASAACCGANRGALLVYAALLGADLCRLPARAARLRADAGQAISRQLRAIARRRDARPHGRRSSARCRDIALKEPGVENAVAFPGLSINGFINSPSAGIVFVDAEAVRRSARRPTFPAWRSRRSCRRNTAASQDALIAIFPPPPVQGLGTIGGFKLQVEDRTDLGDAALDRAMQDDPGEGARRRRRWPACSPASTSACRSSTPISTAPRRMQLGVDVQDVFDTMQIYLGSHLCQRFQPFRPHLSGDRAGRHAVPLQAGGHPAPARPAMPTARWCRSGAMMHVSGDDRAGQRDALQRLPLRRPERRRRRPAIRRARRRRRSPSC